MRAIVTGMIATFPVGGVAWDYGQYILGLEKLGFEVYYLEDTGWKTYDPVKGEYGEDPSYGLNFLDRTLSALSSNLKDKWHFRSMNGDCFGIDATRMAQIIVDADLFLNISGGTLLRDHYLVNPCKIFIDTDPGWNHFVNFPKWDKNSGWEDSHGWRAHNHFFTYAENVGQHSCILPTLEIHWLPTRPPVVVDCWHPIHPGSDWTTVMTWKNFNQPIEYRGELYGTKEVEFLKIENLPNLINRKFEIAIGGKPPFERLKKLGWSIFDSVEKSKTLETYQDYIQQSKGEISVAKNVYVATHSGWFSCRSVCYLASSRPVIVQDTGFSRHIPTGEGLFAFDNIEQAKAAIEEVERDYPRHQQAARAIACDYFDSDKVIGKMLEDIGLTG